MKNVLHISIVIGLLLINEAAFTQQSSNAFLESYGTTGVQEQFYKNSVLRSTDGNTYICGATINANGDYDMLLTKLNSSNVQVWSVTYAGSAGGDDFAADLVQDSGGNIIITGAEYISATNYNAVTIKYNNSGVQQWLSTFNGAANSFDGGVAIAKDNSNNIYVCGGSFGTSSLSDFLCIKYNSSGTQQWASTWNSVNLQDVAVRLAVSSSTVSVIGASQQTANDWKMATVRFSPSNGSLQGSSLTGGDDEGIDKVADLAIDASDNTYVVGAVKNLTNGYDLKVMKLNASLTVVWQQTFNGTADSNDEGLSLELTSSNDVVVCGFTTTTSEGKNFLTTKYAGSNGSLLWSKTFDADDGADEATSLKLDASGNAILCGSSYKKGNLDYVVQKLKASNGDLLWTGRWNSDNNADDIPMNVAIDENDNGVYVAGQSSDGSGNYTYIITRWSQKDVYIAVPIDGFSASGGYIQNRNQLRNANGTANTSVKFYCQQNTPSTYVDNSKISYQFSSFTEDTTDVDTLYRVDMAFKKGVGSATVYPVNERSEYANFYLGHMPKKAERTSTYNALAKLGVYTNTDVIFTNNRSGYRHWIVARSGAPTADFTMEYSGQTALSLNGNGDLVIETTIGNHTQPKAKVYEMNNLTGVLTLLGWQPDYVINSNQVSFNFTGSWSGTLVIEMENEQQTVASSSVIGNLDWSSFTGGTGFDQTFDNTSDEAENVWVTGEEQNEMFADAPGSLELSGAFGLQGDLFVAKFNELCQLEYFTAYGGSGFDRGWSITHDETGQVFAVGYTDSDNLPNSAPVGSLDDGEMNGIADGVFLKLNPDGVILLDSYIGGDGVDFCSGVAYQFNNFTNQRDLWICGNGNDPDNFPTQTFGAYNQPHAGGHDGFVMRLVGPEHTMQWCSWYGSEDDDFIGDIAIVTSDPVFIGVTKSTGYSAVPCNVPNDGQFPNCDNMGASWQHDWFDISGTNLSNYFMGRFSDQNLSLRWSTFMGAAPDYIISQNKPGIVASSEGFTEESQGLIFITGSVPSLGASEFPLFDTGVNNYNQSQFGGGGQDMFLTRFRVVGTSTQLTWSTFIGGENDENGFGLAIDGAERMFVTGWVNSSNMQPEADWCTVPDDNTFPLCNDNGLNFMETDEIGGISQRTIIMAFDLDTKLLWSSQFGEGEHNVGRAVAVGTDKLFLAGHSEESWTDLEFDELSDEDYFQPLISQYRDGSIARFDIPTIIGIEEFANAEIGLVMIAFPNPTSNSLAILFNETLSGNETLLVYNAIGQQVKSISLKNGIDKIAVDVSDLSSGVYQLVLKTNNGSASCSFVKE